MKLCRQQRGVQQLPDTTAPTGKRLITEKQKSKQNLIYIANFVPEEMQCHIKAKNIKGIYACLPSVHPIKDKTTKTTKLIK